MPRRYGSESASNRFNREGDAFIAVVRDDIANGADLLLVKARPFAFSSRLFTLFWLCSTVNAGSNWRISAAI